MIITLASSKGGVGKSTITGCLAGVWAADGNTVHIVDLDNNRTVSRWFADAGRRPRNITVSAPDPTGLTEHLAELAAQSTPDLVLIDVAGTYERALTVAVARAHLTLIPAAPTEADIFEASRVARHITSVFQAFGREPLYRLLLNRVQPLSSSAQLYATLEDPYPATRRLRGAGSLRPTAPLRRSETPDRRQGGRGTRPCPRRYRRSAIEPSNHCCP
jgi:chromosome partitioning protein